VVVREQGSGNSRIERSRQSALDATLALVAETGFARLTIDAVAARAHVSKATVYRLWPGKDELITDAVATLVAEITVPDTGTLAGDVRALMREAVALYANDRPKRLIPEVLCEMSHNPELARTFRSGWLRSRRRALEQVLRRARARGDLRGGLDFELCLDLIGGVIYYRFLVTGGKLNTKFADAATDVILNGLAHDE